MLVKKMKEKEEEWDKWRKEMETKVSRLREDMDKVMASKRDEKGKDGHKED